MYGQPHISCGADIKFCATAHLPFECTLKFVLYALAQLSSHPFEYVLPSEPHTSSKICGQLHVLDGAGNLGGPIGATANGFGGGGAGTA